jgi:hypothetical protein
MCACDQILLKISLSYCVLSGETVCTDAICRLTVHQIVEPCAEIVIVILYLLGLYTSPNY